MRQPLDQEPEVIADGREHGVDGVAGAVAKIVAAHAVLCLEMPDQRLDGGAAPEGALDRR
jgi:hypothetical protein